MLFFSSWVVLVLVYRPLGGQISIQYSVFSIQGQSRGGTEN